MDVDFYRYFIGREDQSVNEKVMISRIDQQIYVTKSMISMYELRMVESKSSEIYDQLSCYYDDSIFDFMYSFQGE